MGGLTDVSAYLGFKSLTRCIEGWLMRFTERHRMIWRRGRQSECMCTFHCSAEQKIIIDGAPSSRDFPNAAMDGWGAMEIEGRGTDDTGGLQGKE